MINFTIGVFIKFLVLAILTAFAMSCGADPDDYKVKESDGCASDDLECEKNKTSAEKGKTAEAPENGFENDRSIHDESITIENNIMVNNNLANTPVSVENADNCMAGKICRGMTKGEILELAGEPTSFEKDGIIETWVWRDDYPYTFCGVWRCAITFQNGMVYDQENVNGSLIDFENF
jgi:hypothetical protein